MANLLAIGERLKLKNLQQQAQIPDNASSSGNENMSPPTKTKRKPTSSQAKRQSPPTRVRPTLQGQYDCLWPNTPTTFACLTYLPPPEEMIMPSDGAVRGYRPMPTEMYPEYLSPPAVHFSDATKPETAYLGGPMDDSMPPFMSYSGYPIPGVDLDAAQPSPYDQMPHVSTSSSRSPAPIASPL